jgi:hypothetical protein
MDAPPILEGLQVSKSQAKKSEPTAEDLAKGNAEILAAIEARAPADGRASDDVEPVEPSVTVTNLQANPMKVLRLTSYGEATFTQAELARNPLLVKKLERAELLGLVKIEGK